METGLYYLQSRYYDPEIGRFINVDSYISTGQGLLGYNMFSYCNNNPVIYADTLGNMMFSTMNGPPDCVLFDGGRTTASCQTSSSNKTPISSRGNKEEAKARVTQDIVSVAEGIIDFYTGQIATEVAGLSKTRKGVKKIGRAIQLFALPDPSPYDEVAGLVCLVGGILNVIDGFGWTFKLKR